jgi:hypothetical protein
VSRSHRIYTIDSHTCNQMALPAGIHRR